MIQGIQGLEPGHAFATQSENTKDHVFGHQTARYTCANSKTKIKSGFGIPPTNPSYLFLGAVIIIPCLASLRHLAHNVDNSYSGKGVPFFCCLRSFFSIGFAVNLCSLSCTNMSTISLYIASGIRERSIGRGTTLRPFRTCVTLPSLRYRTRRVLI